MADADDAKVPSARPEYERRAADHRRHAAVLHDRFLRLNRYRGSAKALLVAIVWQSLNGPMTSVLILGPVIILAVAGLVIWANRATRGWQRALRAAAYNNWRLGFLDDRWHGSGAWGMEYVSPAHPYAADLDLFGRASLFERLCTARTRVGRDTLAGWLLAAAEPSAVRDRQIAVADLRTRIDLRETLACTLDGDGPVGDPRPLFAWAEAAPLPSAALLRAVAILLTLLVLLALVGVLTFQFSPLWFWLACLLAIAFGWTARTGVSRVLDPVAPWQRELAWYTDVLARWEEEPLKRVAGLRLDTTGAGQDLGVLVRLLSHSSYGLRAGPLLGRTRLAYAVEVWRVRHGAALAGWLAAVGRIEALAALATYAFEYSADPFPEVVCGEAQFLGQDVGHPLLPRSRCVRNDVMLERDVSLLIVSGSNMSGKSTLLRTVGINAVLALAGAPVCASRLCLSALAIGATLRVQDSLADGQSRFFAEITRLRQILDLAAGSRPVLFLLDELLSGTNSEDRRAGAEAVVRRLVESGSIGMVTTHDLALTPVADVVGRGANVHFADTVEDGRLVFDYRMRPGVVQQRNALALMRAVGIEV